MTEERNGCWSSSKAEARDSGFLVRHFPRKLLKCLDLDRYKSITTVREGNTNTYTGHASTLSNYLLIFQTAHARALLHSVMNYIFHNLSLPLVWQFQLGRV